MLANNELGWPILSWIVFLPGVGGLIILFFVRKHQENLIRWLANRSRFSTGSTDTAPSAMSVVGKASRKARTVSSGSSPTALA